MSIAVTFSISGSLSLGIWVSRLDFSISKIDYTI
jgi:hypothetical protein